MQRNPLQILRKWNNYHISLLGKKTLKESVNFTHNNTSTMTTRQPFRILPEPTTRLQFQDSDTKIHYGLWYCDIVKLLLSQEEDRIVVEHSTGKLFIDGLNLEDLFSSLHAEKVDRLKVSAPALAVEAVDPKAVKIKALTWEGTEEEEN